MKKSSIETLERIAKKLDRVNTGRSRNQAMELRNVIEKERTIEYKYCDWCGDHHDIDDLTLMINGSLACEDCYEQAMAEMNGEQ